MGVPIKNGIAEDGEATIDSGNLHVQVANFPATQPVSGSVAVSNLPGTQTIAGTVSVSNLPNTQPVSGTLAISNFPVTQPISGTITANIGTVGSIAQDATLTGGSAKTQVTNFPATQSISGTVSVSNLPVTQPVSGTVAVSNLPVTQSVRGAPAIATYAAVTASFTPAAGDIFVIGGSASKTVKLVRLCLGGTQTTAGSVNTVSLVKRSSANTGGTAVPSTRVALDSPDPVSTATVQHYTTAPTPGTIAGAVWGSRVTVPAVATVVAGGDAGSASILDLNFERDLNGRLPTLRGTSEQLCVNLSAVPTGAANFSVTAFWTEE